ncbi:hypothetical protein [Priestia megaterium]|uniref:hypothetical protein n=1 Tax=Priestia megaterium TaxID=1404 RepID=UPI0031013B9A
MDSSLLKINFFMTIVEAIQTYPKASISVFILAIVVFLILKGQLNLEINIKLNTISNEGNSDKDK